MVFVSAVSYVYFMCMQKMIYEFTVSFTLKDIILFKAHHFGEGA